MRDLPGVAGDQSREERLGETRQDLELARHGRGLQAGTVLGEVLLRLGVSGQSVALADHRAGELCCQRAKEIVQRRGKRTLAPRQLGCSDRAMSSSELRSMPLLRQGSCRSGQG